MARKDEFFSVLLALASLTHVLQAQCVQDNRSSKTSGLMIVERTITGTQSLNSTELARLTRKLTGSCVDENQEELGERLRALFQDEGYFQAEVQNVHIKVNDPLALPKPVTVEVEVKEGRRFKVGGIKFVGNHVFSASDLRRHFALNKGDLFARNKIGNGLEGVRDLYVADGFMDWVAIPDTELSDGTVDLIVSVVGPAIPHRQTRNLCKERGGRTAAQPVGDCRGRGVRSHLCREVHRQKSPPVASRI